MKRLNLCQRGIESSIIWQACLSWPKARHVGNPYRKPRPKFGFYCIGHSATEYLIFFFWSEKDHIYTHNWISCYHTTTDTIPNESNKTIVVVWFGRMRQVRVIFSIVIGCIKYSFCSPDHIFDPFEWLTYITLNKLSNNTTNEKSNGRKKLQTNTNS